MPPGFDVVLSADNAIPHLLSDEEILVALRGMYSRLRTGGGCLVTLRDYERFERGRGIIKPCGIRDAGNTRYLIWQVWDFEEDRYTLSMYFVKDDNQQGKATTHVMRSKCYAIAPDALLALTAQAGFKSLERLDDAFFQPVLVGIKGGSNRRRVASGGRPAEHSSRTQRRSSFPADK